MGIKGLMKVISDHVPSAIREQDVKNLFGRKVAIDASMCMYQFMVAVRTGGDSLTNENGDVTSHLQGMFYRTLRLLDFGIKPVYVFDGKAPEMKSGELAKRKERRDTAEIELKTATEAGNTEDMEKFSKRLVKVTREQNDDCKKLLRLMGVPVVEAPCEAEAMCAEMAKKGVVYGVGTEDMDSLTFGAPKLLRHQMAPASRNEPIIEIDLAKVLEGLGMDMTTFVDLCILLGCDYTSTIRGIGPVSAMNLMKQHKSIKEALNHINTEKHTIPIDFQYAEAALMFHEAEVEKADEMELKWGSCDEEGLIQFLVNDKGFQETRVRNGIERMKKSKDKGNQKRLDSFFTIIPKKVDPATEAKKRKAEADKKKDAKKKK